MVGEDWQAVLLWKALFDAGVYTNVALHPAVPPGGALLRTSLMATHEREHLDRALEIFGQTIERFPERPDFAAVYPGWVDIGLSNCEQAVNAKKKVLVANDRDGCRGISLTLGTQLA